MYVHTNGKPSGPLFLHAFCMFQSFHPVFSRWESAKILSPTFNPKYQVFFSPAIRLAGDYIQ
jgi:hypothetical protein